jgi:DNA transformation protein
MKRPDAFLEYVLRDLMADLRGVSARPMFGAFGLYKDGVFFGIVADDRLYLKVNASNRAKYEAAGSEPLRYDTKKKKDIALSYWEVPADVQEDREELARWVAESCRINRKGRG